LHPLKSEGGVVKSAWSWVEDGEENEDAGSIYHSRSNNHFHNPWKQIENAGLSDTFTGLSLIEWAQSTNPQSSYSEGDQSWLKLQAIYYSAMVATNIEDRNKYLAQMFKAIGHQMHLIQDCAVPDHVRNDTHALNSIWLLGYDHYMGYYRCVEGWADNNIQKIDQFASAGGQYVPSIDLSSPPKYDSNLSPYANLCDSHKLAEGASPTSGIDQGLAEYTNANFFSEDTMFSYSLPADNKHYFPYPAAVDINADNSEQLKSGNWGWYYKKITNGATINHLCRRGYIEFKLNIFKVKKVANFFDDECHLDYASMLIPRAVGYSAAFINYLFRGQIEMSLPEEGIYSFVLNDSQTMDKIVINARNITATGEELSNGEIKLLVRYREGGSNPVANPLPEPGIEKYIIALCTSTIAIPSNNVKKLTFDFPAGGGLPVNATDVNLTMVYHGKIGNNIEQTAIGFKDISEPTPIDLFNDTDRICYNGSYVNYNNADLWNTVDVNPKNGVIDCFNNAEIDITQRRIKPICLSFNGIPASSTNYYYKYENGLEILPGETPHRFYVLVDEYPAQFKMSVLVHSKSMENPLNCFSYYSNTVDLYYPFGSSHESVRGIG